MHSLKIYICTGANLWTITFSHLTRLLQEDLYFLCVCVGQELMENVISVSSSASGHWRRSLIWCFIILSVVLLSLPALLICVTRVVFFLCRPFGSFVGSVCADALDVGEHFWCSVTLHLKDGRLLCSVKDPALNGLKNQIHPTPFCHLLFSSFLSDMSFKVCHRSGCLFTAFLLAHQRRPPPSSPLEHHFHLPRRLWWPVNSVSDKYCTCTAMCMQGYFRWKAKGTLLHRLTFSLSTSDAHMCRGAEAGQERGWGENRACNKLFTSAEVLILALKQTLKCVCSGQQRAQLNALITYSAIDPLPNAADCLHPAHVKPNCNC